MFGNQHQPTADLKRRSFLSTVALGISGVTMTLLLCVTMIAIYSVSVIDRKTGDVFEFAEVAVHSLPQLAESLPPVLADVLNDRRDPGYAENIEVSVTLASSSSRRGVRPIITVHNKGAEVVSLLSMRVVVVNSDGEPISEMNEWAATPIAADDDHWRGPLLPGAERRFSTNHSFVGKNDLGVEYEITDIRIWSGDSAETTQLTSAR